MELIIVKIIFLVALLFRLILFETYLGNKNVLSGNKFNVPYFIVFNASESNKFNFMIDCN
jgi:hypothetical protein